MTIQSLNNSSSSHKLDSYEASSRYSVSKTIKTNVKSFDSYAKTKLNDSTVNSREGLLVYNRSLKTNAHKEVTTKTLRTDSFEHSKPLNNKIYNAHGKLVSSNINSISIHESYKNIKENIREQIEFLFGNFLKEEENVNEFDNAADQLKTFYQNNPQALEQISKGKIPEYFNVENTARRQFEISLWSYSEEDDPDEFYNKSVELINQAYGDVEKKLPFELPTIVRDTKNAVLEALKQFRDGVSKEDIVFGSNK